ncbi:MAG TPA: head-tail adaptor protein [Allosphingosinicella sp.]|jgi:head-tail adaptor
MAYVPPRPSQLRELVRFERRTVVSDGMGGSSGAWGTVVATVPARIAPQRGGEEVRSQRLSGIATFDVVVRSDSDTASITTSDRIVDVRSGRTFNIRWRGSLDEKGRFIHFACESGGPSDG